MLRFNKKQKYLVFDFETCHLNLVGLSNKPWQLSYLLTEGSKIVKKFDHYIKWEDLEMSAEAIRITGFSWDEYNYRAKPPAPILEEFEKYFYDESYMLVGQNVIGFDIYIHNIFRKSLGLKTDYSYFPRILDTNCFAKAIIKELKQGKDTDLLIWQLALNDFYEKKLKTSLKAQLKQHGIEFDENKLHNSLYDIEKNFEIFQKQLWQIEI